MYPLERPAQIEAASLREGLRRGFRGVGANVWFLGLTSLLTDVSSEMITSVLPLYLVLHLGLSPLGFGLVDGLQHGLTALVSLASAMFSDRTRRHKEVAVAGYTLSAACRLALLPAGGSLTALAAIVAVDRTGKGIRTSPRDALISLAATPGSLGVAFGVHRSLDAVGALLGPVIAFALLARDPAGFDALFLVSFLIALAGLAALGLLVQNARPQIASAATDVRAQLGALVGDVRLRRLLLCVAPLALAVVSDGFLFLLLQRRSELPASAFPLFFVATSAWYALLAAPLGQVADRIGRRNLFLLGHGFLLPAYAIALLAEPGWLAPSVCLAFLGAFYAATGGVVSALAAESLPPERRASGFALVTTVTGLARLLGSVLFGLLWSVAGDGVALGAFAALLVLALAAATLGLSREGLAS